MFGILRYILVATPACVLVFLLTSAFFTQWSGKAISFRPSQAEEPTNFRVLILTDDNEPLEQVWPADLVRELDLKANPLALPPPEAPEDAPNTTKAPYTLSFAVTNDKKTTVVPTNAANALGLSILLWILGLFGRNMLATGSPFKLIDDGKGVVPDLRSQAPTTTAPEQAPRRGPQKTRPGGKKRRGQGRRR